MSDLEFWNQEIEKASKRLNGRIIRTSLRRAEKLSSLKGVPIYYKLENQQKTGSFKLRGATNAIIHLLEESGLQCVVTASTGNHGRSLAYSANAIGVHCIVYISKMVPKNKVVALEEAGAEVRVIGVSQDEAEAAARSEALSGGYTFVPPFDSSDIISGQGTIGAEIMDDLPDVELVLVPLSGGGLAAGVAAAIKFRNSAARVIGVSMVRGAAMYASLEAGHPVLVPEEETLADSLGGGIGLDNRYTFAMARDLLDGVVLLSEDEIRDGIRAAAADGEITEGAGAVGIGALLAGKIDIRGPTVAILSGSNIDLRLFQRIIESEGV